MRYPIAAPDLSGNESAYVLDCLRSTWISSSGPYLAEFERRVAELAGCRHGVAACNGTAALHLALAALDLGPGDEVIVPSLTFVATANAVAYCGAEPVFADSAPDTWCLSPESVARLVGPRTRGIIPVHLYGQPCDMDALEEVAARHGLWIVEDCAESLGARHRGRPTGSIGIAGTFSFFGNKTVVTGEGGMVVTNDDALAERMRLLRGQGMDPKRRYWHPVRGFNYRMTNIVAAIGAAQMERVGQLLAHRQELTRLYRRRLAGAPGLTMPAVVPDTLHACWLFSLLFDSEVRRGLAEDGLARRGIETRPFFHCIHQFPMYRHARTDGGCPMAGDLSRRGLSLPTAPYLSEPDIVVIAAALLDVLAQGGWARRAG